MFLVADIITVEKSLIIKFQSSKNFELFSSVNLACEVVLLCFKTFMCIFNLYEGLVQVIKVL